MAIRKIQDNDISQVLRIFDVARSYMRATGNTQQWADGYPNATNIQADMERGEGYVMTGDEGQVHGYFCLMQRPEPTYGVINGAWLDNEPYGTVHRAASDGSIKGVFNTIIQYAVTQIPTLRVDTHRDNLTMQRALERNGFRYCGIIHLPNGDERLAYQRPKEA